MEQQILVDFEVVKEKVMIISFIIQLTKAYCHRQKTSDLCTFERIGFPSKQLTCSNVMRITVWTRHVFRDLG